MSEIFDKKIIDELLAVSQRAVTIFSEIKKKKQEREAFKSSHSLPVVDWEIVKMIQTKNGYIHDWNDQCEKMGCSIHSVLRKSDGVVFTVGDMFCNNGGGYYTEHIIDRFKIDGNYMRVLYAKSELSYYELKDIQPRPQRTKLFTTEDGVDVFDGDKAWWVNREWRIGDGTFRDGELRPNYKHFSTEEKAKEYITLNKPCLSVNECVRIWSDSIAKAGFQPTISGITEKLKELAKKKLNIEG